MTGPAVAQLPRVGIIDFYGLRSLAPSDLAAAVGVQIGDSLVGTPADFQARLRQVPGVLDADVSAVCCEAGRTILYIGVREAGADVLDYNPPPAGPEELPPEILTISSRFMRALMEGVQRGQTGEDDSEGHSLSSYGPARAEQQYMQAFAAQNTPLLQNVLRHSGNSGHRALAAQVIAYTPDKKSVVGDLAHATRDSDESVRNNAIRALAVMAMYEQANPDADLNIPFAPFIDLLNSLSWTDRNKASFALAALTTARDSVLLQELRARALPALIEMARWRAPGHAMAAAVILGRMADLPDAQIFETFQNNRAALIDAVSKQP